MPSLIATPVDANKVITPIKEEPIAKFAKKGNLLPIFSQVESELVVRESIGILYYLLIYKSVVAFLC